MGLYLRSGKYYYRKTLGGRLYRRALGLKKGQEAHLSDKMKEKEAEILAEYNGYEKPLRAGDITLSAFIKGSFLKAHEHKRSYPDDATEASIILEIIGDLRLTAIGKREIGKIERALLAKKRSTTTVNRYMALLRHLMNHAIEEGVIRENPVKCYVPYIEEPRRRALTDDEARSVLCAAAAIQDHPASKTQAHIHDIITVALNTGLRLSEILNLKREHIQDGLIVLPHSLTKSRRRGVGERVRALVIPINDEVRAVLKAQPDGEYVFDLDHGRDHSSIKRTVMQIRKLSGVEEFSMHYLRHTVSTRLAAQVSIAAAKEMLGHTNLSTTLLYTHPGLDEKQSGVSNLGTAFAQIAGKPLTERKIKPVRG
jgi:integrase